MIEIKNKYKIGVRRFTINWIGFYSLYCKETLRFLSVFGQTIVGPIVTAILFLVVISLASTSILMGKVMGNIVDLIGAPLSAAEVTLAIILAAITRAIIICFLSIVIFSFFIQIDIQNFYTLFVYLFLSSFILGAAGIIAGLWADKFDHMATVTNFIIVPLSFLSGTFFSMEKLPELIQKIAFFNPFFHMIDGFRFSFIGSSDGSIFFGIIYLFSISIIMWFIAFLLYKKGYKIRS